MFEVEINGKKQKADMSFYTAWLYESEFNSKLVQDYTGGAEYEEADVDGRKVAVVDFGSIDWVVIMRILWAAIKTAKESTPPFDEWLKKSRDANLWDIRNDLDAAITDCFFRASAGGAEGQ